MALSTISQIFLTVGKDTKAISMETTAEMHRIMIFSIASFYIQSIGIPIATSLLKRIA
jgi:hypothetical protein